MKVGDLEITCLSHYDGLPIKNKLPEELKERLKTENQWLEMQLKVKQNECGYEMHPNANFKKTCIYYLDSQVTKLAGDEKCCATCAIRILRFCPVAGVHISMSHYCSEWDH